VTESTESSQCDEAASICSSPTNGDRRRYQYADKIRAHMRTMIAATITKAQNESENPAEQIALSLGRRQVHLVASGNHLDL
jgi:glycerate-2-kinase